MANETKDQLLHKLQQRFEGFEGEEPSDAAWADFSQAYTRSKNARTYYRLLTLLLATLMVAAITIWGVGRSQSSSTDTPETPKALPTNIKQTSMLQEHRLTPEHTEPLATNLTNPQPTVAVENRGGNVSPKSLQTKAQPVTQPLIQPSIATHNPAEANTSGSSDFKYEIPSTLSTTTESIVYQPPVKPVSEINRSNRIAKLGVSIRELPFVTFVTDSTHGKPPHHKTDWYLDISYLATQSFVPVQAYPSDQFLNGFAVGVGYPLNPKLTLSLGYQFGKMQQTYLAYSSQTNEETEIISIDTSLFYSYDAKRIMMQIDTLSQTKSVSHETSVTLTKSYTWHAIPLSLSYTIGKPHRMLFVAGGLTTIRVTEEQTNLLTNGSDQPYTTSENKYLFAPTAGLGVYHRIYKRLGVQVSGSYLYYLPNALSQRNSLQLQSGIRIQF